jgi:hypothetical protein
VIKKNYKSYVMLSESLRNDEELVRLVVAVCPRMLCKVPELFLGNKALVLSVIKQPFRWLYGLKYISSALKDDEEVALTVFRFGWFGAREFGHLSERLKNDRNIVGAAILTDMKPAFLLAPICLSISRAWLFGFFLLLSAAELSFSMKNVFDADAFSRSSPRILGFFSSAQEQDDEPEQEHDAVPAALDMV